MADFITVTCIKSGRSDQFGRDMSVGSLYSLPFHLARSMFSSGHVSVVDESVFIIDKSPYWTPVGVAKNLRFSDLTKGRLLASLSASSTATRTGLTVSVSSTSHGIPSGKFRGFGFYFPGCASLPAGWYKDFLYVSANAIQFSLPVGTIGADFSGESVNGGAAYTTQTNVCSLTVPGGSFVPGSSATLSVFFDGGTTAATKSSYFMVDSVQFGRVTTTSAPARTMNSTIWCMGTTFYGIGYKQDIDTPATSATTDVKNLNNDIVLSFDAQVSAAGDYHATIAGLVRFVK